MRHWLQKRRWWVWWGMTVAWTILLLAPMSHHELPILSALRIDLKFIIAKSIHVGMYAVITVWAGWLMAPLKYRFLLIFFLMAHACWTEMMQKVLESFGRGGNLEDVAWDHLGIALGIAVSWRWWTRES